MTRIRTTIIGTLFAACLLCATIAVPAGVGRERVTAWILTRDDQSLEGEVEGGTLTIEVDGKVRKINLAEVLTIQTGSAASNSEEARIVEDLAVVRPDAPRDERDEAVAELTDIGLPVLSPLLALYKDTDFHEPKPLYRLFARIIPGHADRLDRTLDLVRLVHGETLRGRLAGDALKLTGADGRANMIRFSNVRRVAVRRKSIIKVFQVDALLHCSQIDFLDTGVAVSSSSRIEQTAEGLVRLSFNIDGWASDPNGIKVPGPNYKTNLVDGFPFGALIGRIGPTGRTWLAGHYVEKTSRTRGRLYLAVNDNAHWQNNIGSFTVILRALDAYDVGDPQ